MLCQIQSEFVPFFEHKFKDFQGHISHFSRTPFNAKKSLEYMSFLGLPQHEQFYPEGLSEFAPCNTEIQGFFSTDYNFQGFSRP